MAHIFADVEAGHAQNQRILARFQQVDQNAQKLVIFLVEPLSVFTPKLAFVDRRPLQTAGFDLQKKNDIFT